MAVQFKPTDAFPRTAFKGTRVWESKDNALSRKVKSIKAIYSTQLGLGEDAEFLVDQILGVHHFEFKPDLLPHVAPSDIWIQIRSAANQTCQSSFSDQLIS